MSKLKAKPARSTAHKRAAIYVRVSSERQADRVSPQAQEEDCAAYCEQRGYTVAGVYRDVEKYRVGRRLVEPSGTRSDRPQLRRMLADAAAGAFEVMIAWREDRLYRSYRPMLDVLECLEQTGLDIELAKETFDKKIAPVKAWAARMELDAKHERMMMGVGGRMRSGRDWNTSPPYGYQRLDGYYQPHPEEAQWLRRIWQWFGEGVSGRLIRTRLIAGGAPQRHADNKHAWAVSQIYQMLKADYYHAGRIVRRWNGETYELDMPAIVDPATARAVQKRFARWKQYPAGNMKQHALAAGRVVCKGCGVGMMVIKAHHRYSYYKCISRHTVGEHGPGCARSVSMPRLDAEIWRKLWELFAKPGEFERRIEARIAELQALEEDAEAACAGLQERLDQLLLRRQQVISWALEKTITEADMGLRLAGMQLEQDDLERELAEKSVLLGGQAGRLLEAAQIYRDDVRDGAGAINAVPQTPEQARLQFEARRKFVERLVTRVEVLTDKSPRVYTELDLLSDAETLTVSVVSASRR